MSNVGDNERLMVLVEARITDLERNMRRASQVTGQNFGRMRQDARSATRAMEADVIRSTTRINQALAATSGKIGSLAATYAGGRGMGGMGLGGVAGAIGAYVSAQGARQLTDSATQITNALKVAGLEGDRLTAVYDKLFASAQKNSAPLESLVTLYSRIAIVQNELGVTTEEITNFTDNVALALRVAGTDATAASGALLQLSQAMGSGVVRAEEFSSMLEGALPIVQAAAAGIEEAGGSVAKLRALVNDGAVSSEAFFRGFEAGAHILEEMASGSVSTVGQAFIRLRNVLIDVAGDLDDGSGASRELSDALDELGNYIANTDFGPLIRGALGFAGAIGGAIQYVHGLGQALGDLTGASAFGTMVRGGEEAETIAERVGGAFVAARNGGSGDEEQDAAIRAALLGRSLEAAGGTVVDVPARPRITLADYPIEGEAGGKAKGRKGGRGGGGRGGGGRGGGAARLNDFERETEQLQKRTAAVIAETKAMEGLNPHVDDYGFALERARAEHDLLTAAQEAGLTVTPELRVQIGALADSYANATVEAEKLAESQDEVRRQADDMRALGKETMGGFISDLTNGTDAADALANAIGRIGDRLLDLSLDALFTPGKSGGGGGIFGALGSIFGGFRAKGGPVSAGKAYVVGEEGPELFQPGMSGGIVPNHALTAPRDFATPSAPSVTITSAPTFTVDARGAQVGAAEEIEARMRQMLTDYDRQLDRTIGTKIATARGKNRSGF